jgi:hypothetical protein
MKHKSYRERYFEDYEAVKKPCNNKKGYKVIYNYIGFWIVWHSEKFSLLSLKYLLAIGEALSLALYFLCARLNLPINSNHYAAGFGVLTIAAWLYELLGVLRFCFSHEYVKELDYEEIDKSIRVGCLFHLIFLVISVAIGLIGLLMDGEVIFQSILTIVGIGVSGCITYAIGHVYMGLTVEKYHNDNGKVG